MLDRTVHGHAHEKDVEDAIHARLRAIRADDRERVGDALSDAVNALLNINAAIPHHSKARGLVADALEKFANAEKA